MIGIDITKVNRMEKAINRWGDNFIDKIFTTNEKQYCKNKINKSQCYAVRFAVKESFYKAKNHNYGWKAIEIRTKEKPVIKIHISLSHTEDNAIAVVLLMKDK